MCERALGRLTVFACMKDDNLDQPYLGGTLGFASTSNDLQPGSLNYVYLTATNSGTFSCVSYAPTPVAPSSSLNLLL